MENNFENGTCYHNCKECKEEYYGAKKQLICLLCFDKIVKNEK